MSVCETDMSLYNVCYCFLIFTFHARPAAGRSSVSPSRSCTQTCDKAWRLKLGSQRRSSLLSSFRVFRFPPPFLAALSVSAPPRLGCGLSLHWLPGEHRQQEARHLPTAFARLGREGKRYRGIGQRNLGRPRGGQAEADEQRGPLQLPPPPSGTSLGGLPPKATSCQGSARTKRKYENILWNRRERFSFLMCLSFAALVKKSSGHSDTLTSLYTSCTVYRVYGVFPAAARPWNISQTARTPGGFT